MRVVVVLEVAVVTAIHVGSDIVLVLVVLVVDISNSSVVVVYSSFEVVNSVMLSVGVFRVVYWYML